MLKIPSLIKRNTILISISQCFNPAGMQMGYGIGPLMVVALSGSASLAGMSVGLFAVSRFLVAYPVGKITDAYGRKPGILLGLMLGVLGSLLVGLSLVAQSLPTLIVGLLVLGMGLNAAQQLRVAVADMFPASMRARALGFVATGSLAGLVIAPALTAAGDRYGAPWGIEPLAVPWLLLPIFLLISMGLVFFIRPDPKIIGEHLEDYYPGQAAQRPQTSGLKSSFRPKDLLRIAGVGRAVAANTAAQANMSMIMVLTSLILQHQGHSLGAIGLSHAFHSAGMFAFTLPLGWIADRFGREKVLYPGLAITILGAGLVGFGHSFWIVTLGTFLVGLGWSGANVAATALISDAVETKMRGRAIGVLDSFSAAAALLAALVTGPLINAHGLGAVGVMAALIAVVPLLMRLTGRAGA